MQKEVLRICESADHMGECYFRGGCDDLSRTMWIIRLLCGEHSRSHQLIGSCESMLSLRATAGSAYMLPDRDEALNLIKASFQNTGTT